MTAGVRNHVLHTAFKSEAGRVPAYKKAVHHGIAVHKLSAAFRGENYHSIEREVRGTFIQQFRLG